MTNLISKAISGIRSFFSALQLKSFLSVVAVGVILLTSSNVNPVRNNQPLPERISEKAHQIDSVRPKNTDEWNKEAQETKDAPGDRLKNIAEESAKAVQEFGGMYPDTAKSSAKNN